MSAAEYNFTVDAGATFSREFRNKDAAGVPINITGASIAMMARTSYGAPSPALSLSTSAGGITLTDPANGKFTVSIAPSITTALGYTVPTSLVYDIELTRAGVVSRLLFGKIRILPEATR